MRELVALLVAGFVLLFLLSGCEEKESRTFANDPGDARVQDTVGGKNKSEVEILKSWHGDYPVAQLNVLPEGQRESSGGYIDGAKTFEGVWKAFKPGEEVPEIDFKNNLVLFTRNTQFYNLTRIGKVDVTAGVAEVLAMETMSAMPIEDKVAMSLAVVPGKGIKAIQVRDKNIPIKK